MVTTQKIRKKIKKKPDKAKPKAKPKKQRKRKTPHKAEVFDKFALWMGQPAPSREPRLQRDFALKNKLNEATLSDWKNRRDFWVKVNQYRKFWGSEQTGNVLMKLYSQIMGAKDNIPVEAYKLWLQMFADLTERMSIEHLHSENPLAELTNDELSDFIQRKAKVLKALKGLQ